MKLFTNKYAKVVSVIDEVLSNNKIEYSVNIAHRKSIATINNNGVEKEMPIMFTGSYNSNQTIISINKIEVFPKSIINICKQHKVDYMVYTRKIIELMITNMKYNIIPTSGIDSVIKDML